MTSVTVCICDLSSRFNIHRAKLNDRPLTLIGLQYRMLDAVISVIYLHILGIFFIFASCFLMLFLPVCVNFAAQLNFYRD